MAPAVSEAAGDDQATARPQRPADPSRIPWAELLLRVFREDALLCSCGGRRVVLAFVTEKKIVKEILVARRQEEGEATELRLSVPCLLGDSLTTCMFTPQSYYEGILI
jgi:hypothetical protein